MAKTKTETVIETAQPEVTAVATTQATSTAVTVPSDINFMEDVGGGDFSQQDLKLPFWKIAQDLTPEVKKTKPEYIEGCEPGMFINTNTQQILPGDRGLLVIPFAFTHDVTEWKPNRGGLVAVHGKDESLFKQARRNDKNEDVLPNGNTLLLSYLYYCLRIDEDEQTTEPCVLAFSKTAIKHGRAWNTLISTTKVKISPDKIITPAMFYHVYRVSVGLESAGDNQWFVPKVKLELPTVQLGERFKLINGADVYLECRGLREMFLQGQVSASEPVTDEGASGEKLPF